MKTHTPCLLRRTAAIAVLLATLAGGLHATILISDTFTRTGDFLSSSADTGQTWSANGWSTDGSQLLISGGTSSRISGLTFSPSTLYVLKMDVTVTTGGTNGTQDWIGFGFTSATGNTASNSRGFMLHRRREEVQFFSTGTSGAQTAVSLYPFPKTMEIHLATGPSLAVSMLTYKLDGVTVGASIPTDASSVDSVFIANISGSTGWVDNFLLTSAPLPGTETFPGFTMDFVDIYHPGNAPDDTGFGAVNHDYRIGRYEVSRAMIEAYNAQSGGPVITFGAASGTGANNPAGGISWNEAARFVNWLNTSQGYPPAYQFLSDGATDDIVLWAPGDPGYDADNLYRNSGAYYFLPSEDEWYKAAYYDGNANTYYDYATGSDSAPLPVSGGTTSGTAVYSQSQTTHPDIDDAGGLSPYGTMAQGGNVNEFTESAFNAPNNSATESRTYRGGNRIGGANFLISTSRAGFTPNSTGSGFGFRVASASRPEIAVENSGTNLTHNSEVLDFGGGWVGSLTETKTLTVCNSGSAPLVLTGAGLTGDHPQQFALSSTLAGVILGPGECTTLDVTFIPTTEGNLSATLEIASNDADENPFLISLTGEGLPLPDCTGCQDTLTELSKFQSSSLGADDQFGNAVSVSGDTALVGSPFEDGSAADTGRVYVYQKSGGVWSLIQGIENPDATADGRFGYSLQLVGNTAIIGAANLTAGKAYIFRRAAAGLPFALEATFSDPDTSDGHLFGHSVSLSGSTAVVGERGIASTEGRVHIYRLIGGVNWIPMLQPLFASDGADGNYFGNSVSLTGNSLVVGAPKPSSATGGCAYVFERPSTIDAFSEQSPILTATTPTYDDRFGQSVSVGGNTIVIGAHRHGGAANHGGVFIFQPAAGSWTEKQHFSAFELGGGYLGYSVQISGDTVAVGAPLEDATGRVYYLRRNSDAEPFVAGCRRFVASDSSIGDTKLIGHSVSVSGSSFLAGAPLAKRGTGDISTGAAYFFDLSTKENAALTLYQTAVTAAGLSGPQSEPGATPFQDGVPNLLKYAFNMNLAGPDTHSMVPAGSSGLPYGDTIEVSGQQLWRYEYVVRSSSGLIYEPMQSTSLVTGSWSPLTGSIFVSVIDSNWSRVTIEQPYDPATTTENFFRVEVSSPCLGSE